MDLTKAIHTHRSAVVGIDKSIVALEHESALRSENKRHLAGGAIAAERWTGYRRLLGEARRRELPAAQERKRKIKRMRKAQRQNYKPRG